MKTGVRKQTWILMPLLAVALTTACIKKQGTDAGEGASSEIVFGEYGSMTGQESAFGIANHKGVMMAVDEVNAAGGVNGKKVRVITYDDQGKTDEAVTTVTKLITQDHVKVVIGEVASSRSIAAAAVAQQYKVPMVTPSSTNVRVTQTGDYIFRVCFTDPFQGLVMAKFAINEQKLKTAAVFKDIRSDYSMGLASSFTENFKKMGGTIVAESAYSTGDVDFKSQMAGFVSKNPDLIYIPGYYTEAGLIARQARELGFKGVLMGGDGWDSDKLAEIGGKSIVGAYYSTHFSSEDKNPVIQNFVANFKAKFGHEPSGLAAMGYDAAKISMDAARRAKTLTTAGLRDALADTKNFQGVTGTITINSDRNAVKPAVVLKVAEGHKYRYVTTINP